VALFKETEMETKLEKQAKGTRLLIGDTAKRRRDIINACIGIAEREGLH
jgi:hypothetical protein